MIIVIIVLDSIWGLVIRSRSNLDLPFFCGFVIRSNVDFLQIRVSSEMSNGDIILNLDCDMYPNDPDAVMDALCFFLDEEKGKRVCYVQYPQYYNNLHRSNIYSCSSMVVTKVSSHKH